MTGEKEEKNEREEKKEKKFLPADGQVAQDTRSTNPHDYSGPHWIILDTLDSFGPDMEFVKNFTQPDFQAKNFTPQKCVNCDIFLANQQRKCIKYQ